MKEIPNRKASEVLLKAPKSVKQIKEEYSNQGGFCALGYLAHEAEVPMISQYISIAYELPLIIMSAIITKNDDEGWTFEQIGRWLEEKGY